MPNSLTPDQLAEGLRLLEATKGDRRHRVTQDCEGELGTWLWVHRNKLLAPHVSAAEFARECIKGVEKLRAEAGADADRSEWVGDADAFLNRQTAHAHALSAIRSLAAQHNIDLGETEASPK